MRMCESSLLLHIKFCSKIEKCVPSGICTNVSHLFNYREEVNITLNDIITNLSCPIDHGRVSRFNITRSNIWDGAVRGFRRATYSETCDMLVRFTDDAGVFEEGIDTGGPRREFLTLLMNHLKDRSIFDGPAGHRFLVYNANGTYGVGCLTCTCKSHH